MKYLLDTDICIFLLRGGTAIADRINSAGFSNCAISEITKAELLTGLHYAERKGRNLNEDKLLEFLDAITVIPVTNGIERYAREKARLIYEGQRIEDFDLLIGCTAVSGSMVMVTNNTAHFERIDDIILESWKG